jgi:protein SCO1/2
MTMAMVPPLSRLTASRRRALLRCVRLRFAAKRWLVAAFTLLTLVMPIRGQGLPVPEARIEQHLGEQVPLDLVFRDEAGKEVTLRRYFDGKPVILMLAYFRCPRLCSVILNNLTDSLRGIKYQIGKEFNVLTVSFDPREKPALAREKKKNYVESYGRPGAENGWHFLTGEEDQIKRLADVVGFRYYYDPTKSQYAHASGIMVLTSEGKISRYFYGIDFPGADLSYAIEDASDGKVGSPILRPLRLLCFGYDPATGKYTLMTMRLVQAGGLVTVLALALVLGFFWRRERRRLREGGGKQSSSLNHELPANASERGTSAPERSLNELERG